jgi:iron complex transport system substrate-binding protein
MGMNRIVAEIAMSLLLFCCTLPAAASDDYTLGIFGNANEGETSHIQNG